MDRTGRCRARKWRRCVKTNSELRPPSSVWTTSASSATPTARWKPPSGCAVTSAASSVRCAPSVSSHSRPSAIGTSSTPAIPTTSPPARPRSAPCIPTPETRSPTPNCCRRRGSSPGRCPSCGSWVREGRGRGSPWTPRRPWSARCRHSCATRARCPIPRALPSASAAAGSSLGELAGLPEGSSAEMFRVTRIP